MGRILLPWGSPDLMPTWSGKAWLPVTALWKCPGAPSSEPLLLCLRPLQAPTCLHHSTFHSAFEDLPDPTLLLPILLATLVLSLTFSSSPSPLLPSSLLHLTFSPNDIRPFYVCRFHASPLASTPMPFPTYKPFKIQLKCHPAHFPNQIRPSPVTLTEASIAPITPFSQHLHICPRVPEGDLGGRICVSDLVCLCVPGSQPCLAHSKDAVIPPKGLVELVQAYLFAQEHC